MSLKTKYFIAAAAIAALALAGCNKKETAEDEDQVPPRPESAPSKKASDIFDEFYISDSKKAAAESIPTAKTGAAEPVRRHMGAGAALPSGSAGGGTWSFNPSGRYVVQILSTASEPGANRLVKKLKGMGYPAYVATVHNPTPDLFGVFFRVRVGGFSGMSEARDFGEAALRPAGYDYWVDRKSNDDVGVKGSGFGTGAPAQQYQAAPAPASAPAPAAQPAQPHPAPAAHAAPPPPPPTNPAPAPAAKPAHTPSTANPPPPPQPAKKNSKDEWGSDDW
ncbi:MAG: SPOR domain-containing protein [Chitinispirillia bacterium]|nr:SPOR domain-containing protein [Chitinispirillia bacterium]MCL2241157.1 SPOR domain-containing protein [Chitinispirillia bacterium]